MFKVFHKIIQRKYIFKNLKISIIQKSCNSCDSILKWCRLKVVQIMNPMGRLGSQQRLKFYQKSVIMYGITYIQYSWHIFDSELLILLTDKRFKVWFMFCTCVHKHLFKAFFWTAMLNMWYSFKTILLQKGINAKHFLYKMYSTTLPRYVLWLHKVDFIMATCIVAFLSDVAHRALVHYIIFSKKQIALEMNKC